MNNDSEKREIYNIPGVVIPPQKSDNGVIIESSNSINSDVNNIDIPSEVINNIPSNENISVVPSTTENIENNVNITNNSLVTDNVNSPVTVTPIKEEKTPINNTNIQNNNNNKPKKNLSTIYLLIIIVLVFTLIFIIYNNYQKEKNTVDPRILLQRTRIVDNNSLVAQRLFDFVNLDGCSSLTDSLVGTLETTKSEDLSPETKNFLAYRLLKKSSFSNASCSSYPNSLHKNDFDNIWYCGSTDYNSNEENTEVFSSDDLSLIVNSLFGDGVYKATSFNVNKTDRFMYNSENENYIYQSYTGNNSCKPLKNTLYKVTMTGDILTLSIKVENSRKNQFLFNYNFIESDNGNYYFRDVVKKVL